MNFSPFMRSRRPEAQIPEEEEEQQPMLRSGSVRAFSHLPAKKAEEVDAGMVRGNEGGMRQYIPMPVHEDEAEDVGMLPRSGSVRAFSHLPPPRTLADPAGPISTRPPTPVGRLRPPAPPEEDTNIAPQPDDDSDGLTANTGPQEPEDGRPWYMLRIPVEDLTRATGEERRDSKLNRPTRAPSFDKTPPAPSIRDEGDDQSSNPSGSRQPEAVLQNTAYPGSRWLQPRPAPKVPAMQQAGIGPTKPPLQQHLPESQRSIPVQPQVREANPLANSSNPAGQSQAVSPHRGSGPVKIDEGRVRSAENISALGVAAAMPMLLPLTPWLPLMPERKPASKVSKIEQQMAELLLARRAVYDKLKKGNMPLSTDELTLLMEEDYQRGLRANSDERKMTIDELTRVANNWYFYHIEPDKEIHPGYSGFRGAGFFLSKSSKPKFPNPFLDFMARGRSDLIFLRKRGHRK